MILTSAVVVGLTVLVAYLADMDRPWESRISGSVPTERATMTAVVYEQHGPPSVLKLSTVPLPSFGDREILVQVHAVGINPVDVKFLGGMLQNVEWLLGMTKHNIPAFDVAGKVVAVGKSCSIFKVGDEVFFMADFRWRGGMAEYAAVVEHRAVKKPASLTMVEAAALPMVALTSYQALQTISNVQPKQKVLVLAGSGGTGQQGIQIAKKLGAHVATTCSPSSFEMVKKLGADEVVDYRSQNFSDVLAANSFDVVYDCVGGLDNWQAGKKVLKTSGMYVTIVGDTPDGFQLQSILNKAVQITTRKFDAIMGNGPRYELFTCVGGGAPLSVIADWVESMAIKPVVDKVFSLEQAVEAFEFQKSQRAKGKIVFKVI